MARKSANTKTATRGKANKSKPATRPTSHAATFSIAGTIKDVYEGEKYVYVSVNVDSENINPKTNKPYYDTYSVVCSNDMEIPDDGEEVCFIGRLISFYNKVKQRTEYSLHAEEIYGINDAVDLDLPF